MLHSSSDTEHNQQEISLRTLLNLIIQLDVYKTYSTVSIIMAQSLNTDSKCDKLIQLKSSTKNAAPLRIKKHPLSYCLPLPAGTCSIMIA